EPRAHAVEDGAAQRLQGHRRPRLRRRRRGERRGPHGLQVRGSRRECPERQKDEEEQKPKPLIDELRAHAPHLRLPMSTTVVPSPTLGARTRPARRAAASIRGTAVMLAYCDARVAFPCWSRVIFASRSLTETCARRTATLTATIPTRRSARTTIQTSGARTRKLRRCCRCCFFGLGAADAGASRRGRGFGSGSATAAA